MRKRKEERGKRKEERGKRKEERGKRKEERGDGDRSHIYNQTIYRIIGKYISSVISIPVSGVIQ